MCACSQMISLSIDFYIRVFVRVYTSAAEVKNAGTKLAYVYQSQGCESFYLQRLARKVIAHTCTASIAVLWLHKLTKHAVGYVSDATFVRGLQTIPYLSSVMCRVASQL